MLLNRIKLLFNDKLKKRVEKQWFSKQLQARLGDNKLYSFHGGIHFELGKDLTSQQPIYALNQIPNYIISLQQHKGPKPIPVVAVGDKVEAGQALTSSYIPGELPVHSPTAGTIVYLDDYLFAGSNTKTAPTAVVMNQEQGEKSADFFYTIEDFTAGTAIGPVVYQPLDIYQAPLLDCFKRIKNAGIAGLGGAVFPSARKINARRFSTLMINAAECEPYITCDDLLMQKYSQQLIFAFTSMVHLLFVKQVVVAIEDDKPTAIANLQQSLQQLIGQTQAQLELAGINQELLEIIAEKRNAQIGVEQAQVDLTQVASLESFSSEQLKQALFYLDLRKIKIRVIPTVYPSGNQRTTIEVLTGLKLTKKQNLTSLGTICFNIGTIYSMYRSLQYGEVLTQRLVTVTGSGIKQPANYWLPFGVTPAFLAEQLGTTAGFTGEVIMGGPMMGFALDDLNTPINKSTNCLIFVGEQEIKQAPRLFAPEAEEPCIRCTACQEVCPLLLQPQQLFWYNKDQDDVKLKQANLSACVECGLCDYVCPSNIPLVSYFQEAKHRIYLKNLKEQAAEESKIRFNLKEEREKAEKALRDKKREEDKKRNLQRTQAIRQKMMADTGVDPIQAAKERLMAKGVDTGKVIETTAGSAEPDNSSIMEQRRLRREQKRREQELKAQAEAGGTSSAPTTELNDSASATSTSSAPKSAVQAAIARAKALQAKAKEQEVGSSTATESEAKTQAKPLDRSAVLAAVAKAKAKQSQADVGQEVNPSESTTTTPNRSAVLAAVAKAKAKQVAARGEVVESDSSNSANNNVVESETSSVPKPLNKSAVLAAVAKAKAKQAAARGEVVESDSSTSANTSVIKSETNSAPKPLNKSAVLAAVAKDKAKQAVARGEVIESDSSDSAKNNTVESEANSAPKPLDRSAVLAAVAKAKAKQAAARGEVIESGLSDSAKNNTVESEANSAPKPLDRSAVLAAVAKAKAKQVAARGEVIESDLSDSVNTKAVEPDANSAPKPLDRSAVLAAVAKAKAKQAAAIGEVVESDSSNSANANVVESEVNSAPKPLDRSAVLAAVAKAKARQAARAETRESESSPAVSEPRLTDDSESNIAPAQDYEINSAPKPLDRSAVLAAVARAKAKAKARESGLER